MTRPLLIPGLPRVWRSRDELQLGADPFRAVSVHLPDSRTALVLDLLDGTRSERAVLARSAELGIPADHSRALIANLRAAGLIRSATDLIPTDLPPATRRRLTSEAAAFALTTRAPLSEDTSPAEPGRTAQRASAAQPASPAQRADAAKQASTPGGRHEANGGYPAERGYLAERGSAVVPTPAEILRRRWHSRVVIKGHGRLGAPIAVALAEAGVGQIGAEVPGLVGPGDLPGSPLRRADIGRPRWAAISDAILRAAPGTDTISVRGPIAPTLSQAESALDSALSPPGPPDSARGPAAPLSPAPPPPSTTRSPPGSPDSNPGPALSPPGPAHSALDSALSPRGAGGSALRAASSGLGEAGRRRMGGAEQELGASGGRLGADLVVELDQAEAVGRIAVARLVVAIRDGVPVVGPFVPAVGGPCLRCLELHRRDRDASWPGVAPRPRGEPAEPCTVVSLLTATAYIVGEILGHLDGGEPETLGAAVEILGPGRLRRRSWPPHPACPCSGRAG